MHGATEALAIAAGGAAIVPSLTVGVVLQRARRANRLLPRHRTPAPLRWRWSPSRPAFLHRRLRRACRLLTDTGAAVGSSGRRLPLPGRSRRRRPTPGGVLDVAARELIERALAADTRLVELHRRRGTWRRARLPALAGEVHAIEQAAVRVARLRARLEEVRRPAPPQAEQLIDAYEAALAELRVAAEPIDQPG